MNMEQFEFWLPTKTVDELKYIKQLVDEEIKEATQ